MTAATPQQINDDLRRAIEAKLRTGLGRVALERMAVACGILDEVQPVTINER